MRTAVAHHGNDHFATAAVAQDRGLIQDIPEFLLYTAAPRRSAPAARLSGLFYMGLASWAMIGGVIALLVR